MSKLQTVHLRVNDATTSKPTPCRIRISDADGNEYAPFGETVNFSTNRGESVGGRVRIGRGRWFSIPGACEIALPPGELRVQICKGISYPPFDETVTLPAGKMALRFALERHIVCGLKKSLKLIDMRCHFLSPHDAALDSAAEDLDIVNLLAEPTTGLGLDGNSYLSVPNLNAFSGQTPALVQHDAQAIVNTHNRHPVLGSLGLLHCHRPVFPLSFGSPDASDDWSLRAWSEQCHRKCGVVIWTEPFAANKPHAGEVLALAILGLIDAYEFTPDNLPHALRGWYQLLNAGIDLPIVGASARIANDRPLGAMQTAIYDVDDGGWQKSLDFSSRVTNGPGPNLVIDGTTVSASAISNSPFGRVELISNGEKIAEAECKATGTEYVAILDCPAPSEGWVAARILDTRKSFLDETTPLFAHTSAQWIGEPKRDPKAVAFLMGHLDKAREWVETQGRFDEPKFRTQLLATFDEAKAKLQSPPDFPPVPSPPGSAGGEG